MENTFYETQLCNHLTNISEFAKLNDLNTLDNLQSESMIQEQFLRGLLMNLELLADKWKIIDKSKYDYRFANASDQQNLLPKETGF